MVHKYKTRLTTGKLKRKYIYYHTNSDVNSDDGNSSDSSYNDSEQEDDDYDDDEYDDDNNGRPSDRVVPAETSKPTVRDGEVQKNLA